MENKANSNCLVHTKLKLLNYPRARSKQFVLSGQYVPCYTVVITNESKIVLTNISEFLVFYFLNKVLCIFWQFDIS
jgi:hypothetical protein